MTPIRTHGLLLLIASTLVFGGCQSTRNFTTYFNLFYNMERIMDEAEEELLFTREQKEPEPTFYIAYDDELLKGTGTYNHLERRSMSIEETRANKVKLDSIVIKGSKLLARAPNSDYVDDGVYYIAKSYFYQREWYASQKKAEELIEHFSDSKWLPDAHLVLAMDLLHQGNPKRALTMLSRAIDIGWARERLDILVDAFRLNADIHLADGNINEALRPFERAVSLSDNAVDQARWHYEMGVVYFRNGQFEPSLASFERTLAQSPDVFTRFQAGLQRAVVLRQLGRNDQATQQLEELRSNSNFKTWRGLVEIEQLNLAAHGGQQIDDSTMAAVDSAYPGGNYSAYGMYERGINAFRGGEYNVALGHFQKVQSMAVPFQRKAQRFAMLLGQYDEHHAKLAALNNYPLTPFPDSVRGKISDSYYDLARLFTTFQREDSSAVYYTLAESSAPVGSLAKARVMFALASIARKSGRDHQADSLLELLVQSYGLTEYAADARRQLGYTDYARRDTAEDRYLSGTAFMRTGDDSKALAQFHRVIHDAPESDFALMSYYAVGLIFEGVPNRDSAFTYYSEVLNRFPLSEQAEIVRPIIDGYMSARMQGRVPPPGSEGSSVESEDPNVTLTPDGIPRFGETEMIPLDDGIMLPTEEPADGEVERKLDPPKEP